MRRLFVLMSALFCAQSAYAVNLDGVLNLEPEKFVGTWYQIQSTNPFFQRGCKCAKAEYEQLDSKTIQVTNTCVNEQGNISDIVGKAKIKDPSRPSRLAVSFGPISFGRVNYVVTELGENYEYAVIVSPGNSPIWILAREKEIPQDVLAGIRLRLTQAGVRVADLKDTDPTQCGDF
jgi:apolipoprotein D and lipocalin family protein